MQLNADSLSKIVQNSLRAGRCAHTRAREKAPQRDFPLFSHEMLESKIAQGEAVIHIVGSPWVENVSF